MYHYNVTMTALMFYSIHMFVIDSIFNNTNLAFVSLIIITMFSQCLYKPQTQLEQLNDDKTMVNVPPGFNMIHLPYADEIRNLKISPSTMGM